MGGGAFAQASAPGQPTLSTPRMSPEVYNRLKATYLSKLQAYFPYGKVACLIEAPEKADYGDVDLLVACDQTVDQLDLANRLGAVGLISRSEGDHQSLSLAVPTDGTSSTAATVQYSPIHNSGEHCEVLSSAGLSSEMGLAQIDVNIIAPRLMEWHLFYSSYGDMLGLLGHIVRNLGFTITDRGFWLRLQELDDSKKVANSGVADKDGYIFLTLDPRLLMAFIGLSVDQYKAGFATLEQLFEWLLGCRMLHPATLAVKRDTSNMRQRARKRNIYSEFFFEWLPAHKDMKVVEGHEQQLKIVRDLRKAEESHAVDIFSVRQEYETKHDIVSRQLSNAIAINLLKPIVARHSNLEGKKVTEVIRAFKRHVLVGNNAEPSVTKVAHADADTQLFRLLTDDDESFKDGDAVDRFVRDDWATLKALLRLGKEQE